MPPGGPCPLMEAPRLSLGLDKEVNSSFLLASLSPGSGEIMGGPSFLQPLSSAPRTQLPVQRQVDPGSVLGSARGVFLISKAGTPAGLGLSG